MPHNAKRKLSGLLFGARPCDSSALWITSCAFLVLTVVSTRVCAAEASQPPQHTKPPKTTTLPAWRGTPTSPLSCSYCNLQGMDLHGRNLTDANLAGADLRNANLKGAMLDGAVLIGAKLDNADLSNAKLNASTRGGADLSCASLAGAKFEGAWLVGAALHFAELRGTDFTGADLTVAALGPCPKTGVHNGRSTSFRNAKVERQFTADSSTADVNGIEWIERKASAMLEATP